MGQPPSMAEKTFDARLPGTVQSSPDAAIWEDGPGTARRPDREWIHSFGNMGVVPGPQSEVFGAGWPRQGTNGRHDTQ